MITELLFCLDEEQRFNTCTDTRSFHEGLTHSCSPEAYTVMEDYEDNIIQSIL